MNIRRLSLIIPFLFMAACGPSPEQQATMTATAMTATAAAWTPIRAQPIRAPNLMSRSMKRC